ncbi:MAG: hypothetical protein VCC99_06425, partial [Alphaproteobacteria bacterium]
MGKISQAITSNASQATVNEKVRAMNLLKPLSMMTGWTIRAQTPRPGLTYEFANGLAIGST